MVPFFIMLKIIPTSQRPLNQDEIVQLHEIMRIAYEVTEIEIWGPNYIRLYIEDFTRLIESGNIFVAYLNNKIVGSVHIYSKDKNTYSFGLLSVDFNVGGQGIGTALIERVEEEALKNGAKQIKMEILRVKNLDVPHKIRLANYYKRLGYQYDHSEDCACIIPDWKYKLLKKPSDFDFYVKKL